MARFILRYRGPGAAPHDEVEWFRGQPGIAVVDDSPRMLLVDAAEPVLRGFLDQAPDWEMSPELSYALPEPQPSLGRARSLKRSK